MAFLKNFTHLGSQLRVSRAIPHSRAMYLSKPIFFSALNEDLNLFENAWKHAHPSV
jgi:DMSO reductase anchor subunit